MSKDKLASREKKICKTKRNDEFHLYLALNKTGHLFTQHFKHSENRSRILNFINDEKTRLSKTFTRHSNIGTSSQENILELEQGLDNFEKELDSNKFIQSILNLDNQL